MDLKDIEKSLQHLRAEHRKLDLRLEDAQKESTPDMLTIQRLKKQKLQIKDEIARLEGMQYPDIIA